jgi:nuclear receptor co-repressor 1
MYNQPSDTEVYNNNKKNYTVFKKKLVEYFKKRSDEGEQRNRYMVTTYCKLTSQWTKKVDRMEGRKSRKEREGRAREQYEKIFPELRKQREDKERDARLGTRGVVKSDADLDDVLERLHEQEMEDKKMHSYAVIPPLLKPPDERRRKFTNNNGLMQDPMLIYKEREYINMWTDAEKELFSEKYLQQPKNFAMIAQYLERKTVSDCVQYYYLSKKTVNYKQLLRKTRQRPRQRRAQAAQGEVIAPNLSGVVTRRKVEEAMQGGKEGGQEGSSKGNSRSNTPGPAKGAEENGER